MNTELGKPYRDRITGFAGIAAAKIEYLTGCSQTALQPRMTEGGKPVEQVWFDDPKLEPAPGIEAVDPSDFEDEDAGADFAPPARRG